MSDSVQAHRQQPTRLRRPWDSPGKNTGVSCHFLVQCMKVRSESEVAQSCPTLSDPMDCSAPGSSVHGIFQARALEWGAIAFSVTCINLRNSHHNSSKGSTTNPILQMKKPRHRDLSNLHKVTQLARRRQQYKVLLYSLLFYFSQPLIKCHYLNYQIYNLKLRETGG